MPQIQRDLLVEYKRYATEPNNQNNVDVPDETINQETETVYDSDSGDIDAIELDKILHFLLSTIIKNDLDKEHQFKVLLDNEVFIPMFLQNHYSEMRILINTTILSAANRDTMNVEGINPIEVEDVLKEFWSTKKSFKADLLLNLHAVILKSCEDHKKEFMDERDRLLQDAIDQEEAQKGTPVSSSRSTPTLEYSEEDNTSLKRKRSNEDSDDELVVDESNDKSFVQNPASQNVILERVNTHPDARRKEVENHKPDGASDRLKETNQQSIFTLQRIQAELEARIHSVNELIAQNQALQQKSARLVAGLKEVNKKKMDALAAKQELQRLEGVVQSNDADNFTNNTEIEQIIRENDDLLIKFKTITTPLQDVALKAVYNDLVARLQAVEDKKPEEASDKLEETNQQLISTLKNIQDVLPAIERSSNQLVEQNEALQQVNTHLVALVKQEKMAAIDAIDELVELKRVVQKKPESLADSELLSIEAELAREKLSEGPEPKIIQNGASNSQSSYDQSEPSPKSTVAFRYFVENLKQKFQNTNSTGIKQIIRKASELAKSNLNDDKKFEKIAEELHKIAKKRVNSWWSKSHFFGHGRSTEAQIIYDKASKEEFSLQDENERTTFMEQYLSSRKNNS